LTFLTQAEQLGFEYYGNRQAKEDQCDGFFDPIPEAIKLR
jgi:hypothetical protein